MVSRWLVLRDGTDLSHPDFAPSLLLDSRNSGGLAAVNMELEGVRFCIGSHRIDVAPYGLYHELSESSLATSWRFLRTILIGQAEGRDDKGESLLWYGCYHWCMADRAYFSGDRRAMRELSYREFKSAAQLFRVKAADREEKAVAELAAAAVRTELDPEGRLYNECDLVFDRWAKVFPWVGARSLFNKCTTEARFGDHQVSRHDLVRVVNVSPSLRFWGFVISARQALRGAGFYQGYSNSRYLFLGQASIRSNTARRTDF